MRRVILGCGGTRLEGWIGIDKKSVSKAHIVRDIERGLPFDDSSVDEMMAIHVLEHIKDLIFVMSEVWRVCKAGTRFHVQVPLVPHESAFRDPTHVRYFVEDSFKYFEEGCGWCTVMRDEGFVGGFRIIEQEILAEQTLKVELEVIKR